MAFNNLTFGEPEKEKTGREMSEDHEIIKKSLDHNVLIQPLLTDLYQITMAYSYWRSGKINDIAVFDVNFRRNPFSGEFTIFAGLEDCLKFLQNFHYTTEDIDYLRKILPDNIEEEFYQFLAKLDARDVILYAIKEGNVVFPKIPLIRLEGPLIVLQLIETTILNLVNYASLVTTNAARFRMAAGDHIKLYEFGLRRAQGPDGGLSASKYSYMGGCDGTSNVLAGKLFGIPVKGTHAHSYVTSFKSLKEIISTNQLTPKNNKNPPKDFFQIACDWRDKLIPLFKVVKTEVNEGEFAAFISFAQAFPDNFMALVDTFDVLKSGLVNFCAVALALYDFGYQPIGIRIDSGDLAYLSRMSRGLFKNIANKFQLPEFEKLIIMASNDINEETILSLNEQQHSIDTFGIGTHLVTCQKQPALGCVYKLVELNNDPRMKLTQDIEKITIPGKKNVYRLYGDQYALVDIMQRPMEEPPLINKKVLCRHPFLETKRAYVVPVRVENLLELYWNKGELVKQQYPTLEERRTIIKNSLNYLRPDIKRTLNPTPYKVAVTDELYNYLHDLWLTNAPIGELF